VTPVKRSDLDQVLRTLRKASALIEKLTGDAPVDETATDVTLDAVALLRRVPDGIVAHGDSPRREAIETILREIQEAIEIIDPVLRGAS